MKFKTKFFWWNSSKDHFLDARRTKNTVYITGKQSISELATCSIIYQQCTFDFGKSFLYFCEFKPSSCEGDRCVATPWFFRDYDYQQRSINDKNLMKSIYLFLICLKILLNNFYVSIFYFLSLYFQFQSIEITFVLKTSLWLYFMSNGDKWRYRCHLWHIQIGFDE